MAEYAGYVAPQSVDFGKIGTQFVSNLISLQEKKAEYDEKKQLALDKQEEKENALLDRQNEKIQDQINKEFTTTGSQDIQRVASEAVNEGANTSAALIRLAKIDRKNSYEYTRKAQSIARSVGNLRQVYDAFGKGYQEIVKLGTSQNLDPLGEAMAKVYTQAGDLKNVNAKIANEEKVVLYKKDPDTGEEIVYDPETLVNYPKFISTKVDYNKLVDDFATNRIGEWESTSKPGPLTKMSSVSVMNNPLFEPEKKKFVNNLVATPWSTAKFLTSEDKSYQIYTDEKEKSQLIKDGFDEKKLIKLGKDSEGYPMPIVSDDMKKEAEKLAGNKIQAAVSYKTSLTRDPNIIIRTGGSTEKEPNETEKKREAKDRIATATVADIESGRVGSSNIKNFILGLTSKYDVDPSKTKLIKLPNGSYGIKVITTGDKPNLNFGQNGIITSYDEIVTYVPDSQVDRILISDQKKKYSPAKSPAKAKGKQKKSADDL